MTREIPGAARCIVRHSAPRTAGGRHTARELAVGIPAARDPGPARTPARTSAAWCCTLRPVGDRCRLTPQALTLLFLWMGMLHCKFLCAQAVSDCSMQASCITFDHHAKREVWIDWICIRQACSHPWTAMTSGPAAWQPRSFLHAAEAAEECGCVQPHQPAQSCQQQDRRARLGSHNLAVI